MFFRYSYKKYLKEIEVITYKSKNAELLKEFPESYSPPEECLHFMLGHFSLINTFFFLNFTKFPSEMTGVGEEEHLRDLSGLFLRNFSKFGITTTGDSGPEYMRSYFIQAVRGLISSDFHLTEVHTYAESSARRYFPDPLLISTYAGEVQNQAVQSMECMRKLVKTF